MRRDPSSHRQIHYNESKARQVNLNQDRQHSQSQNYVQSSYVQKTHENDQRNQEQLINGNLNYLTPNKFQTLSKMCKSVKV